MALKNLSKKYHSGTIDAGVLIGLAGI